MKSVLIVSALPQETEYISDYVNEQENWKQLDENNYINADRTLRIHVRVLGVGKVNAAFQTADAINEVKPDLIVNIGVAGGLADDLDVGSLAIGTDYVQVDLRTLLPENAPVIAPSGKELVDSLVRVARQSGISCKAGKIATGDFVLYEEEKRRNIKDEYDPIAFDMESAAIAQVATAKGIDFVSIRCFTDMANTKTVGQFSQKKELDEDRKKLLRKVFRLPAKLIVDYLNESEG